MSNTLQQGRRVAFDDPLVPASAVSARDMPRPEPADGILLRNDYPIRLASINV
jgi:hypothetical protein